MRGNFYIILGVPVDATLRQIKAAYRRRARQLHPDLTQQDNSRFLELQEAYETLSDSSRRAEYDRQRSAPPTASSPRSSRPRHPAHPPGIRPAPPPPGPDRSGVGRPRSPADPTGRFHGQQDLGVLHVAVSPAEAREGGQLKVRLALPELCPTCRGGGRIGYHFCPTCAGAGALEGQTELTVSFPPRMASPWIVRLPCSTDRKRWITVRFTVEPRRWPRG